MIKVRKSAIAPAYLLACLILGGSAQGIWPNMILQLVGVGIIAWAGTARTEGPHSAATKSLLLLAIAAIAWVALQLIPLAPSIWAHGARSRIAEGFSLLGKSVPAIPLSLTPYETLSTILCVIPPLAIFCAMTRLKAARPRWLATALIAGACASVLLAALQAATPRSLWHLYNEIEGGVAVGFFANADHMATLLVISIPFIAALAVDRRSSNVQRYAALVSILVVAMIILIVGLVLNGSLAGYTLTVPVIAATALIILPRASRGARLFAAVVGALSIIATIVVLASSSTGSTTIDRNATAPVQSREQILSNSGKAIVDYMPFGSGLGSFARIYPLYESPDRVSKEYVVHADNDYVELALELGVPGIILILLFLGWWIAAVSAAWRKWQSNAFAKAASIASAAVLAQSLVDFPLRTAAISSCFAMCLAMLTQPRPPQLQESGDLRPTRHVVVA